eukprot:CAMPEP_0195317962 /NCGR_PEP_ID=MMETSP0708-20121125/4574_1 /TAXON_ID=33640 /ORGANISM="Asterionellopsis glacialis, Strain CCMP134" /LENGTH=143 /DNA_ID=CAMNT_0040383789 /DNA_START=56 /DNA_END=487 /DNA_ORIENTATION=-
METREDLYKTVPLKIGNLFDSPWNKKNATPLHRNLLEYYVSCGWNCPWEKIMQELAARGDIEGMGFVMVRGYANVDNVDYCTNAAAAGHLKALRWLREEMLCPWDSIEVYQEASENMHLDVMKYVEINSDEDLRPCWGQPWQL